MRYKAEIGGLIYRESDKGEKQSLHKKDGELFWVTDHDGFVGMMSGNDDTFDRTPEQVVGIIVKKWGATKEQAEKIVNR